VALVALGSLFGLWRFHSRGRQTATAVAPAAPAVDLQDDALTADRLPEDQWYALGEEQLRAGDLRAALRAFYLGNLAWLNSLRLITIHAGKTNLEYAREMERRARAAPDAAPLLGANIEAFERSWYGRHIVAMDDIEGFRGRLQRMKEVVAQ
jgi:hypothetical protein